jgi:hypothetical protein
MKPGDIAQWIGVFLLLSAFITIYRRAGASPELCLTGASVWFTLATKWKHEVKHWFKNGGDKE